jgi:quercetin dioxygenase-like cupin family protein
MPRVLFSAPECRVVVLDLQNGEALGDHHVRERAVIHLISGSVAIEVNGEVVECSPGAVVTFEPGERHAVRARSVARLLLVLAPWTKSQHPGEGESADGEHVPANATVEPDRSLGTTAG